ncbi:MAG: 28S ribosomal protein S5, mitochondrial [Bogoriella megaspora]|nr:MAG: 28S ribosomal protein S5, mitochondrial [Bogoriella megaspora]
MGSLRPTRGLISIGFISPKPFVCAQCRPFHGSVPKRGKRRPIHQNIKAVDMGLIEERIARFQPYTQEEKEQLAQRYTPEQMAAIEAGESSISAQDLATQGTMRDDEHKLPYISDLATVDPVIDHPVSPKSRLDPANRPRPKSEEEITTSLNQFINSIGYADPQTGRPPDATVALQEFLSNPNNLFESDDPHALIEERPPQEPLLPKIASGGDVSSRKSSGARDNDREEEDPHLIRLMQQTGFSKQYIMRLRTRSLVSRYVANQTRMGKIHTWYHLAMAGNGKGMLGIGEGKAAENGDALRQAKMAAIRNMKPIPRYEERTIFGELKGKVGGTELRLTHRPPGFGLRCQHLIFEMARAAGIGDLSAKVLRSRNKMNVCKATFKALTSQKLPEEIALARGKKLVDVRKVYYGGNTM